MFLLLKIVVCQQLNCNKIMKSHLCSKFYKRKQSDCVQNLAVFVKDDELCDKDHIKKCVKIWDVCFAQMMMLPISSSTTPEPSTAPQRPSTTPRPSTLLTSTSIPRPSTLLTSTSTAQRLSTLLITTSKPSTTPRLLTTAQRPSTTPRPSTLLTSTSIPRPSTLLTSTSTAQRLSTLLITTSKPSTFLTSISTPRPSTLLTSITTSTEPSTFLTSTSSSNSEIDVEFNNTQNFEKDTSLDLTLQHNTLLGISFGSVSALVIILFVAFETTVFCSLFSGPKNWHHHFGSYIRVHASLLKIIQSFTLFEYPERHYEEIPLRTRDIVLPWVNPMLLLTPPPPLPDRNIVAAVPPPNRSLPPHLPL